MCCFGVSTKIVDVVAKTAFTGRRDITSLKFPQLGQERALAPIGLLLRFEAWFAVSCSPGLNGV